MQDPVVILFYKFVNIDDPFALRDRERKICESLNLKGRMFIAEEGINATFEGSRKDIEEYEKTLKADDRFSDIVFKESAGTGSAFAKLVIKVRDEIVTLGVGRLNPQQDTAPTITAEELEEWYEKDEDFVVLDLRNSYEIESGYFDKTVDPGLSNFRDLPQKLSEIEHLKNKKVVPVCTGGIRCEKATCLLKKEGFNNLYQLKDGIHTYIQKYPARHFKGTLFVFDNRMTTPVVPDSNREIIGKCSYCAKKTENYANNDSVRPSRKVLCCEECFEEHKSELREVVAPVI